MPDFACDVVVVGSGPGGYPETARIICHPALPKAVMEAARAVDGWLIHS